ncbi:MAG: hypothetical protein KJ687_10905, partial [Proteobacteria bacterium]|nr:hypothetical protein [Pseudomonadota bacterium]
MLKGLVIQIFGRPGLIELIAGNRRRQEGIAMLWLLATLWAFFILGAAMVITSNVSLFGQIDTSLSLRAESVCESGYRFLRSEYERQTTDVAKNALLVELYGDELNRKVFNIATDGSGQFQL